MRVIESSNAQWIRIYFESRWASRQKCVLGRLNGGHGLLEARRRAVDWLPGVMR